MLNLPINFSSITIKPARLVTITREDGQIFRFAEAQASITVGGGETWSTYPGFQLSAVKSVIGAEAASVQIDLSMSIGGLIDTYEVVDGFFENADVQIDAVDRANPTTRGFIFSGRIGPITFGTHNNVSFDVRGWATKASWPFVQSFGPMCRTDLGSRLCRVPLRPPIITRNTPYVLKAAANGWNNVYGRMSSGPLTPDGYQNVFFECTTAGTTANSAPNYNFTIGATTTDGSAVFTARDAWTRHARVADIINSFNLILDRNPDPRGQTGWFNQGAFRMYDGYTATRAYEIGAWTADKLMITTYLPLNAAGGGTLIHAGDWLEIWRGCDMRIQTCSSIFDNSLNFRGEPYFAGAAQVARDLSKQ